MKELPLFVNLLFDGLLSCPNTIGILLLCTSSNDVGSPSSKNYTVDTFDEVQYFQQLQTSIFYLSSPSLIMVFISCFRWSVYKLGMDIYMCIITSRAYVYAYKYSVCTYMHRYYYYGEHFNLCANRLIVIVQHIVHLVRLLIGDICKSFALECPCIAFVVWMSSLLAMI